MCSPAAATGGFNRQRGSKATGMFFQELDAEQRRRV